MATYRNTHDGNTSAYDIVRFYLAANVSHKNIHSFWRIIRLSITLSMDKCELDAQFIGDGGHPVYKMRKGFMKVMRRTVLHLQHLD